MDAIFERTSVRKYRKEDLKDYELEKILKAAMQSPSAVNQQPWEYIVVTNKEMLNKMSKIHQYSGFIKEAPCAIVVAGDEKKVKYPDYLDIDLAISTENIVLEAKYLGIGSCIIGISPIRERMENLANILNLEKNKYLFAIITLGYPFVETKAVSRFDLSKVKFIK